MWASSDPDLVIHGDCGEVLPLLPDGSFQMVYIDPPFNTGRVQRRETLTTTRDVAGAPGSRVGFHRRNHLTI